MHLLIGESATSGGDVAREQAAIAAPLDERAGQAA